ncbi:hypothetical protein [Amycolatopsis sp. H20-H5]|uniref:hypothetical protein n=1 Tax=Amycolatopsis sp. H20-H5 TaxID=3046309 RepID=UPI003FA3BAEA
MTTYGKGDVGYELGSSTTAAVAGYPDITVPAGYAGELPVGLSFFAGRWSDASVLSLAAAFEKAEPPDMHRSSCRHKQTDARPV